MKMIELWPRPVFGPTRKKRFGKPATVAPRYAVGLPAQWSWRRTPPSPVIRCAMRMSVTWKPVAKTIVSTWCSSPLRSTMPSGRIESMPSVTRVTFGFVIAGYQRLLGRMRF
jgi:hypothetical protein